jgi:hypothetical protein
MSLGGFARKRTALCVPLAVLLSVQGMLYGQECCMTGGGNSCGGVCQHTHCPPPYYHCLKGAPCIKFKCGCPLPVCPPCEAPNWGYYQPCWRPWPWPPNWSHCPYPVPAALIAPCPQSAHGPLSIPTTPEPPRQGSGAGSSGTVPGPGL